MVVRWILYGTAALFGLVLFSAIYAPASITYRLVSDQIVLPELSVLTVGGSVWDGHASVRYQQFPDTLVDWQLGFLPLLSSRAELTIAAEGTGHRLTGRAELENSRMRFSQVNGVLEHTFINQVSSQHGLRFSGQLDIADLELITRGQWLDDAQGDLHWQGGQVLIPGPRGQQALSLPPLHGKLDFQDDRLSLNVTSDGRDVFHIYLNREGWATLEFRARVLELANLPWPMGGDPDTIVFTVEEQIFRGRDSKPTTSLIR